MKKNYWISWYHVREFGEFELHFPWWVTGTRVYDRAETVCAAVQAESEADARLMVEAAYDRPPYDVEWRFVTEKPLGWSPYSDRFRQGEWMRRTPFPNP